jgi:hypothetical protein
MMHAYLNVLQFLWVVSGVSVPGHRQAGVRRSVSMNLGGSRTTQNIFLQFFALSFCSLERAREKGGRKGRREGVRRE